MDEIEKIKNTKVLMLYDNNDEYVYKCCTNIIIELNKKIRLS